MSNFIFVGRLAILTEDVSKRSMSFEGAKATIKTTILEVIFDGKSTRIAAK